MKTPSAKVFLIAAMTAFGITATLASPAFAQHRELPHHQRMSHSPRVYDRAPLPDSNVPYYGNAPYDQRDDW